MDLKVFFVTVFLFAFAITSLEAVLPKCCVKTKKNISPIILRKVTGWEMQQSNGACDINALILHVKGMRKPICAHPSVLWRLKRKKRHDDQGSSS
ncbi:C-C motif chemokine 27a [Cheilinus undulatus]|uniref:C-C motif chemokine 27a n=1 Tax=Cheilinus undulatus TaxID=241271 RepID=UPI001BD2401D|nr:C-C motif chemokine 27a [Cheilinus undulatus]